MLVVDTDGWKEGVLKLNFRFDSVPRTIRAEEPRDGDEGRCCGLDWLGFALTVAVDDGLEDGA